jgi:hypothetical protein
MPSCKKAYLTTTPSSMPCRGKSKCFAMHLATSPLQACHNTHSKPTRDIEHEAANVANKKNQGQHGQPSSGGGGTNNGGGQNGLYRGNGNGSGGNPGGGMTFNGGCGSYPTQVTSNLLCPSKNSTIGTIAIPMVATSIIATQAPPVRNPVSITNMLPPGPTLWVVTTRVHQKSNAR